VLFCRWRHILLVESYYGRESASTDMMAYHSTVLMVGSMMACEDYNNNAICWERRVITVLETASMSTVMTI
jgi:hypothetical protein